MRFSQIRTPLKVCESGNVVCTLRVKNFLKTSRGELTTWRSFPMLGKTDVFRFQGLENEVRTPLFSRTWVVRKHLGLLKVRDVSLWTRYGSLAGRETARDHGASAVAQRR